MNITPISDLVVGNASGFSDPSVWFDGVRSAGFGTVNSNSLAAALKTLINALQIAQLTDAFNPLTTPFAPVAGNVIDDTLTALGRALKSLGIDYATLRSLASNGQNFQPPIGLAQTITSQYAGIKSGSSGTVSNNTVGTTNQTSGQASNGTPNIDVNQCAVSLGSGGYGKCQSNAIANFGPLNLTNRSDGEMCGATYTNGTLTVKKGLTSISGSMNGNLLSDVYVFGSGSTLAVDSISTFSSNNSNVQLATVSWNANGSVASIFGQITPIGGILTKFTCTP